MEIWEFCIFYNIPIKTIWWQSIKNVFIGVLHIKRECDHTFCSQVQHLHTVCFKILQPHAKLLVWICYFKFNLMSINSQLFFSGHYHSIMLYEFWTMLCCFCPKAIILLYFLSNSVWTTWLMLCDAVRRSDLWRKKVRSSAIKA